jgi:hypothetical protein
MLDPSKVLLMLYSNVMYQKQRVACKSAASCDGVTFLRLQS